MANEDDFARSVGLLYAAALGETSWDTALDHLTRAAGFDGAALYVLPGRPDAPGAARPGLARGLWHNLNTEHETDYQNHYFKIDPCARMVMENPRQRLVHDYMHTHEDQIDKDEFYAWYLATQGTRYHIAGQFVPEMPFAGGLTLHRRAEGGPVGEGELERFSLLFDNLERALLVDRRLQGATAAATVSGDMLESNPTGVVLLDEAGTVVHANQAAREIAARRDSLHLDNGTLGALRPTDHTGLSEAIALALAGSSATLRLQRRWRLLEYIVIVIPLPRRLGFLADRWPAAAVLICEPGQAAPNLAVLASIFGLTQQEGRVALSLLSGKTIAESAAALGVSVGTARFHLAAIFRKTATTRQAELMRLLMSLPWHMLHARPD